MKYRIFTIEELDNLEILPVPNLTINESDAALPYHHLLDKRIKELLEYLKSNYELKIKDISND